MPRSIKIIFLSILFATAPLLSGFAKVTEVPFIELPTGQVVIQIDLKGKVGKQYFILETAGSNLIRRDMPQRLDALGIDTTIAFIQFPEITIGDMIFTKSHNFRFKRGLSKRSEHAFPVSVLGTLGSKFFNKKSIQFNFQQNTLRIADSAEELEITPQTPKVHFTQSFTNHIPVFDIHYSKSTNHNVYIDVSLAIGICLPWKSQSQNRSEVYEMTLDGKKKVVFSLNNVSELYLNRELTLHNTEIMFSDDLAPSIGNLFLRNFISTIDFDKGILFLEPITKEGIKMFQKNNPSK